jgi:peptidyl-prolyl cis-trans isomerase C
MATRIIVAAGFLLALASGTGYAEEFNPVVGKLKGFVLREADVNRLLAAQTPEIRKQVQDDPQQIAALVRRVLTAKAVADRARQERFDKQPEVMEQLGYLVDNFLAEEYLRKIVVAGVTISDDDLKKYYKEHQNEFILPEQALVRHIFIGCETDAKAEERAKAREKAEKLLLRLQKGEDFARVALDASEDDTSARKGGELGYISTGKTNSEVFEKAVQALKVGEMSGVVETPFGYHIIRVDERREKRTVSFDEAKELIRKTLQAEKERIKAQEFIAEVTTAAGLEIPAEKGAGQGATKTPK